MPVVTTTTGRAGTATSSARRVGPDAACAEAVDLARDALRELTDDASVGDHLEVTVDGDRVVTHLFACLLPGYAGWRWAVTVARASRGRAVTVDESVLLPGPDSLLAPEWVPWSERLRPGDLGVGDLLPTDPDDDRLEPGWNGRPVTTDDRVDFAERDDALDWAEAVGALDLTRRRVLSPLGLDDALDRWLAGDGGPASPLAQAAPATCATCGFRVALLGRLGQAFGICANEYSPSDGRAVSFDHGCGGHSETGAPGRGDRAETGDELVIDELGYDVLVDTSSEPTPQAAAEESSDEIVDEPVADPAPELPAADVVVGDTDVADGD